MKLTDEQRQTHLQQLACHPLLQLLPDTPAGQRACQSLLHKTSLLSFAKNELIFLQHAQVQGLYFLLQGSVSCHRQLPNGQETLVHTYHEQGLINESVLWHSTAMLKDSDDSHDSHDSQESDTLSGLPRTHSKVASHAVSTNLRLLANHGSLHQLTAKAHCTSVIACLPVTDYFRQIQQFELGGLLIWFAEQVSERLYQHLILSDLLTFKSAKAKLGYYLLTHFDPLSPFVFASSQKQLANQLGLRAETLNRTLRQLLEQGILAQDKAGYRIADIDGLLRLINE